MKKPFTNNKFAAKKISNMSPEELLQLANTKNKIAAVVQEISRRRNASMWRLFVTGAIGNHDLLDAMQEPLTKYLFDTYGRTIDKSAGDEIFRNYLTSLDISGLYLKDTASLRSMVIMHPSLTAYCLLAKSTPSELNENIISKFHLSKPNITVLSFDQGTINFFEEKIQRPDDEQGNLILHYIYKHLKDGYKWSNFYSFHVIGIRYERDYRDDFLQEVAKYDLSTNITELLFAMIDTGSSHNQILINNLANNENIDVVIGIYVRLLDTQCESGTDLGERTSNILNLIKYLPIEQVPVSFLLDKIAKILESQSSPGCIENLLSMPEDNNIVFYLVKNSIRAANDIIFAIYAHPEVTLLVANEGVSYIMRYALSNPQLHQLIKTINPNANDLILSSEQRNKMENICNNSPIDEVKKVNVLTPVYKKEENDDPDAWIDDWIDNINVKSSWYQKSKIF